jgi:hypothetical protein
MIWQMLAMSTEHRENHKAPDPDEADPDEAPATRPASLALRLATYSGPAAALGLLLLVGGLLVLIGGVVFLFAGLIGALIGD